MEYRTVAGSHPGSHTSVAHPVTVCWSEKPAGVLRPCLGAGSGPGGRRGVGTLCPHAPTCQAGRTFSMSFRLIPSPSSSFPFPHLDQKRQKGIERMVRVSCPSLASRKSRDNQGPSFPKGLQNQPVPPRGNGHGDPRDAALHPWAWKHRPLWRTMDSCR